MFGVGVVVGIVSRSQRRGGRHGGVAVVSVVVGRRGGRCDGHRAQVLERVPSVGG